MNVYFLSTLLFLPVLIQGTSPIDKSPPRIPPSPLRIAASPPDCVDKVLNCQDFLALCENIEINRFMKEHCQKSCGHCEEGNCNSSEGYFKVPNSNNQCFKYDIKKGRTWNDSSKWCNTQGLRLAEPREPEALRKYLVEEVENWANKKLWLGARGTGNSVRWISDGTVIANNSNLWHDGGIDFTETSYCLELISTSWGFESGPYRMSWCETSSTYYALCELTAATTTTTVAPTTTTAATTTTTVAPTTTTAATTTTTLAPTTTTAATTTTTVASTTTTPATTTTTPGCSRWSETVLGCLRGHNKKVINDITFETCKQACGQELSFLCKSVDYWPGGNEKPVMCQLSTEGSESDDLVQPCWSPYGEKNLFAECLERGGLM